MTPSCHLLPTTDTIVGVVNDMGDKTTPLGPINRGGASYGVGPWEGLVPEDPRYSPELLALGDRRNVEDHCRYWTMDAIRESLKRRFLPFKVAIENLGHDFDVGSIVRTTNVLGAVRVHIVGHRRWNRRGAMVTNRYLEVDHVDSAQALTDSCASRGLVPVSIDSAPGSLPLESTGLPRRTCLVFGEGSNGLNEEMIGLYECVVKTSQRDSTRSTDVGHAAAIVMWEHARKLSAEQK